MNNSTNQTAVTEAIIRCQLPEGMNEFSAHLHGPHYASAICEIHKVIRDMYKYTEQTPNDIRTAFLSVKDICDTVRSDYPTGY